MARSWSNRARMPSLTTSRSSTTPRTCESRATASGVAPCAADAVERGLELRRRLAALLGDPPHDGVAGALAQPRAVDVDAAHARLRRERHERRRVRRRARARAARTAWRARRSSVPPASRRPARRAVRPPRGRPPRRRASGTNDAAWRLPSVMVPVLSRRRTSTSPDASTARPESASTLRRTSRSMPAMPIAESSAPIVVGMSATSSATSVVTDTLVSAKSANGPQRDDHREEDHGEADEQDAQGDLVRRLAPLGALDEADHAIEERLAGLLRDLDDDAVGQDARAAGDRRAVAAGLPNDRGGLPGDGRLVDRRDALDDGAVAGDDLAGLDDHDVAAAQLGRGALGAVGQPRRRRRAHGAQRGRLCPAAALGDRLGEVAEDHREPQPDGDGRRRTSAACPPRR